MAAGGPHGICQGMGLGLWSVSLQPYTQTRTHHFFLVMDFPFSLKFGILNERSNVVVGSSLEEIMCYLYDFKIEKYNHNILILRLEIRNIFPTHDP